MYFLCRDCSHLDEGHALACPRCSSSRLIFHPQLPTLSVAHIDCDAFFAAIEKRDNPDLRDKPVIVGGGKRGVVATCCYIARLDGVRSAMPMFKALKACPNAVVIKPNGQKYSEASRQIRAKLEDMTPLVQMVSIDEGYIDLSGTMRLHGRAPASQLAALAREIERDVGITISIGLSGNRFLAKMASEMDKPRGFAVIDPAEAASVLGPMPVSAIHGVGPAFASKLARDGFRLISDVQSVDQKSMIGRYGESGQHLWQRAHGIDHRPVSADRERKSVSAERTFNEDISSRDVLTDRLWSVCEETANRAKKHGVAGYVVTLKLKTNTFRSLTRSVTLLEATQLAGTLFRITRPLLDKETLGGTSYRLIGVGISDLHPAGADQIDLIDPGIAKRAAAERAVDKARDKFGEAAVRTGRAMRFEQQRRK
ncbi:MULTISPECIES: DNA polymerase IV [Henriciella]|jgi:DNA polymerase IV|uniref:DNA polymerase IV n=1 Tax=Henriciella pelagia TaxID=1977912 RepID=A0ABQ1J6T5_9PROT|nr:DNA polymerase IV [Henriciella pelagia]GGB61215.1 DNA polymerase IV [Henriciella pelagia]